MRMSGTEVVSIELAATISPSAADALALRVPPQLTMDRDASGEGHIDVLAFEMRGLGLGWPLPRLDYLEVLYRLGTALNGVPAWLVLRCDVDRALVRTMAAAVIRYPVRAAAIQLEHGAGSTNTLRAETASDSLSATLFPAAPGEVPPVRAPRRTFVVDRDRLFEVPWDERPAPERTFATVRDVESSACLSIFGAPVTFASTAVVHRGRTHICGRSRAFA
ncbi:hypothetical protein BH11MYX4_BH11MYX4_70210 [soil metagenome]